MPVTGPFTLGGNRPPHDVRQFGSSSREPRPLSFGSTVLLSKDEVFGACQALADADRALLRAGRVGEATALGDLFQLLEQRLAVAGSRDQQVALCADPLSG